MKLTLPKSLLIASVAFSTAYAKTYTQAETITGTVQSHEGIVVNGKLNIGDGSTPTNYSIVASSTEDAFIIDGEGSYVKVDNATISAMPADSQLWIGYGEPGSAGTMEVTNKSVVDISNATTLGLWGTDGAAILDVSGGSEFVGGYNNLWMYGNSTIKVTDASLAVCTSTKGYNYRAMLAIDNNSHATIEIGAGGSFTSNATQFVTNYGDGSVVDIVVKGKDASFIQSATTQNDGHYPIGNTGDWVHQVPGEDGFPVGSADSPRKEGLYDADSTGDVWVNGEKGQTITYLCDSGTDEHGRKLVPSKDCITNITASEGGVIEFNSALTYIGGVRDSELGISKNSLFYLTDKV